MSQDATVHKTQKQRQRSPSYPSVSLARAIECVQTIYEHEGKYFAPVGTILGHWGYKGVGGRALRQLAALKKFGLIEDQGSREARQIKLSELALDIVTPDSPRRQQALRVAALKPTVHQELRARFSDGLPSAQNVRFYLIRERGFTDKAAAELLDEYRATLEFAGLDGGADGRDTVGANGDVGQLDDEDTSEDMDTALQEQDAQRDTQGPVHSKRTPSRLQPSEGTAMTFPLVDQSVVSFSMPTGMTEAEWQQWMTVLAALKPSHVIADPPADE